MNEWKEAKLTVWDIEQSIHQFHNKIARILYRSYATTDAHLAVAFGVAQGVLAMEDIPKEERSRIEDIAKAINRNDQPEE